MKYYHFNYQKHFFTVQVRKVLALNKTIICDLHRISYIEELPPVVIVPLQKQKRSSLVGALEVPRPYSSNKVNIRSNKSKSNQNPISFIHSNQVICNQKNLLLLRNPQRLRALSMIVSRISSQHCIIDKDVQNYSYCFYFRCMTLIDS